MIGQIKTALEQSGIEEYRITESVQESLECFFIRKRLDQKRRTDLTDYSVTVFRPFEKDGQKMLGSSTVNIHPGMEEKEMTDALQDAYGAAALVCNPYYELTKGKKEEMVPAEGRFAGRSLEESTRQMLEALYAADNRKGVFINSAEIFARRVVCHIVNSQGVDVSYETYLVSGEYVVQCTEPQDVETYHRFAYRDAQTEQLRRQVEEALSMTQARAKAVKAPKAGEYSIILSGEQVREVLSYYLGRSQTGMVYQKYSNYEVGAPVQGQEIQGDAITIELKAKEPYSGEGIPMKDRILMEKGTLKTLHGGSRFAYYLGIEPTGDYRCISVPEGSRTLEEMKSEPYLHIVSFSDFQMDDFSGYFGGEIRLAFWYDGETVTPVTGGSVNGSILEVQGRMTFSRERYQDENYDGPYAVRIEGVKVAGE
ncbi:MAG: hypothetical protein K2G28_03330 [Acetatifactor sp.]|nr:hypothetical protein [Acetatifactor sp.]MDE7352219.1 hypothetical protein [Acetatifactor sp.]